VVEVDLVEVEEAEGTAEGVPTTTTTTTTATKEANNIRLLRGVVILRLQLL
jgi:hypothetical protein